MHRTELSRANIAKPSLLARQVFFFFFWALASKGNFDQTYQFDPPKGNRATFRWISLCHWPLENGLAF